MQLNVMVFDLSLNLSLQIDHFKNQILFTILGKYCHIITVHIVLCILLNCTLL